LLAYPATIDLSAATLRFLTARLPAHRRAIGCRWRKLTAARQALLVLAHLRGGDTYARLAAGFRIGVSTVYRYIREAVDLLATLAPSLADAVRVARTTAYVILDGTLISIDRVAAERPYYSGKHRRHGMNVQLIADPAGRLVWVFPALPGAVHDIKAARAHGIIAALTTAAVAVFADKGYVGAGGAVGAPVKGRHLPEQWRAVNRAHAKVRALGEQAMAMLKNWRLLRMVRCCPNRITAIVAAVLALHLAPRG
jgi:hypothetical protein